ncbi:hypothetical protein HRI_002261300 [Hibiscus trionum]|uniref:Uncharacterized protein n=1 Tax=Hibiscus trionum TaxID=183268 RepID=A0A9W7HWX3_HIBTR|nr:hypothetical protein HRI_002261300 [Hibiscus trionum]
MASLSPPRRRPICIRGRIRAIEPELNQAITNPSIPIVNEPAPAAPQNLGSLNEGDASSFTEQPTEENPNNDAAMEDLPPTKDASALGPKLKNTRSNPRVTLPPRALEPQPLNTIFPHSRGQFG